LKRLALGHGAKSVLVDMKHGNVAAGIPGKAAAERLIANGLPQTLPVRTFWNLPSLSACSHCFSCRPVNMFHRIIWS
jgi:hypothetical protein